MPIMSFSSIGFSGVALPSGRPATALDRQPA
jgi:hypothetical protein